MFFFYQTDLSVSFPVDSKTEALKPQLNVIVDAKDKRNSYHHHHHLHHHYDYRLVVVGPHQTTLFN